MAFVGNIDQSIEQLVNSAEHDLFAPLPPQFDLAVMDRFACYLPGWEMPKNSSAFLTDRFGLITDFLAEAFHYQLKHTNRYEEISSRIRLGKEVEGRDEKGIKKSVAAFLKILHPLGEPSDAEFDEYVEYAIECRRRVKEQMNKRKPDDEFARINLSYINAAGAEVVVYCPESKDALATQEPDRRKARAPAGEAERAPLVIDAPPALAAAPPKAMGHAEGVPIVVDAPELGGSSAEPREQHFTILYGDTGYTYESFIGPYLTGAKAVTIEEPYIRARHQVANFVRFCETVLKAPTIRTISLVAGYDDQTDLAELQDSLGELQQSLLKVDVVLEIEMQNTLHDREIRIDNGWVIKIGRGLDFYQKPDSWFAVGTSDFSLRKCLETKVDIFKLA